jgi:hypothetical protein
MERKQKEHNAESEKLFAFLSPNPQHFPSATGKNKLFLNGCIITAEWQVKRTL